MRRSAFAFIRTICLHSINLLKIYRQTNFLPTFQLCWVHTYTRTHTHTQASEPKACHILKLSLLLHVLITLCIALLPQLLFLSLSRSTSLFSLPLPYIIEAPLINIHIALFSACRRLHPDDFEVDCLPLLAARSASTHATSSCKLRTGARLKVCQAF